jgi:hypothetical protein
MMVRPVAGIVSAGHEDPSSVALEARCGIAASNFVPGRQGHV